MGGMTRDQFYYLKDNNFIETLQKYNSVLIGISAGAINFAIQSLSLKERENEKTIVYNGIGLTDKTIYPHFNINDTKILDELKEFSKELVVYGICENSAIIEKKNELKIIGDVYRINKQEIIKIKEL